MRKFFDDVWLYLRGFRKTAPGTWFRKRDAMLLVTPSRHVYAEGGSFEFTVPAQPVWVYDTDTDCWNKIAPPS